jgi:hypothetical protein
MRIIGGKAELAMFAEIDVVGAQRDESLAMDFKARR